MQEAAVQLKRQIGMLNMALHLSNERKQNYMKSYHRLDDPKLPKSELTQAIKAAQSLLDDNMTTTEVDSLEKLYAQLKSEGITGLNKERIGFFNFQHQKIYQPSWALIQAIKQNGYFNPLSPQTRKKCQHIQSFSSQKLHP